MEMESFLLPEHGQSTMVQQEKFKVIKTVSPFELYENYHSRFNGARVASIQRIITITGRIFTPSTDIFTLGQGIDATSRWAMQITNRDSTTDIPTNHIAVSLELVRILHYNYPRSVICRFKISIVDKDGDVLYAPHWQAWDKPKKFAVSGEVYTMRDFIRADEIFDNKEFYMPGNILRLKIEGVIYGGFVHAPITVERYRLRYPTELSRSLWTDMELADVELMSNDEKVGKAHKLILGKASPVFAEMFAAAGCQQQLSCDDLSESEITKMLEFIYTGNILEQEWSNYEEVSKLFEIAATYEIRDLKAFCQLNLIKTLSLTRFQETLEIFCANAAEPIFLSALHKFFLSNQEKLAQQDRFRNFAKEKKDIFLTVALYHNKL